MTKGSRAWRSAVALVVMAASFGGALAAAPAASGAPGQGQPQRGRPSSHLSARLDRLTDPSVATASPATQARAAGLPADGPGSLLRRGRDRVLVYVTVADTSARRIGALQGAGASVVNVAGEYSTVTVEIPVQRLRSLAAADGVVAVREALTPAIGRVAPAATDPVTNTAACTGIAVSEGDAQLEADIARTVNDVDGTGVKVGILSDSFATAASPATTAAQDVANGDLPGAANPCGHTTPVQVLADLAGGTDEGRGMAQIVHDVAPGATLAFATAFNGMFDFAARIIALRDAGAKVIVDDVTYFDEPWFQDGPVAKAVNAVTASGVAYFSSAGNNSSTSGGALVGSYAAPFRYVGCPSIAPYVTHCHDFNPTSTSDSTFGLTIGPGKTVVVDLQWAEQWYYVGDDFDLYLLDANGNVLDWSEADQASWNPSNPPPGSTYEPFEAVGYTNNTGAPLAVNVVVNRYSGTSSPELKLVYSAYSDPSSVEYTTSTATDIVGPSILGHNGAASAITVGAVPYNNASTPEPFTSRGPVRQRFAPIVDTPGDFPAATYPSMQTIAKPDIAATDGGATSFFGSNVSGTWRFYGTSAAAPHAAAVGALMLEVAPGTSPATLKSVLAGSGRAVGSADANTVGAGLIDASVAVAHMQPSITVTKPNGGETCTAASSCAIQWTSVGAVGSEVSIDLLKGGVLDQTIAASAPTGGNSGSYSWSVPADLAPASDYAIRVTATAPEAHGATDASDAPFTIRQVTTVTQVLPNTGPLTAQTLTVHGTGFVDGATTVKLGTIPGTDVDVVSPTELTFTAPATTRAGKVDVIVTSSLGGTSANTSNDDFTYYAKPVVSKLNPTKGDIAGGNTVVITGSSFVWGQTTVAFGDASAVVTDVTPTSITVKAPAHDLGKVDVTVTAPGGTSATNLTTDDYTYAIVPTVTGVSPAAGPTTAQPVTITGTGFIAGASVKFGTAAGTNVNVVSATQLTVTAPARSAGGTVDVTVTTPGGASAIVFADHYTYIPKPVITSMSSHQGAPTGGENLVITGSSFPVGGTSVSIGGLPASILVHSTTTQITVRTPAHAVAMVDVVVTTAGGSNTNSTADDYKYAYVPWVSGVSPNAGPVTAQPVTITGSGFIAGATTVKFGTSAATNVNVISDTQLTAVSPPHTVGKTDVTVTTFGGTSSGATQVDDYTYVAKPTVTKLTPARGDPAGGNDVVITGTGFTALTTTVTFDGVIAPISVAGPTTLTVQAPAHDLGKVDVVVTTPGGSNTNGTADDYTYALVPTVTGLSPSVGPLTARSVTVSGTNFVDGATTVKVGTSAGASVVVVSPTELTVTVPARTSAATLDVVVTTPAGSSVVSEADKYTYAGRPTITSVSPAKGEPDGGNEVVISGTGFPIGATTVTFGGVPAEITWHASNLMMNVVAPAHDLGKVDIVVTTPGGSNLNSATDDYTYAHIPVITELSPHMGPLTAQTVTITGDSFVPGATTVLFGTLKGTNVNVVSPTELTVTAPARSSAGRVDVVVSVNGITSFNTSTDDYQYFARPSVTRLSPTHGSAAGGYYVDIAGANLQTFEISVTFGGAEAPVLAYNGSTIRVQAPTHVPGVVDVVVTTPGGTSLNGTSDNFTYDDTYSTVGVARRTFIS